MTEPWRISLFGTLRVQRGDRTISRFKSQKTGGLLAYMAFHLRQAHPREVLIEVFWPESTPEAGRASLSTALSSLRHQLEPPGTPANSVIRADRFSVGLNPAMVTTDVAAFEAAIRAAARAENATDRAQELARALDLYQGRLLPGFYEDWIVPEQERLAGLYFDAAASLIALLEETGDLDTALRHARQAVSVDPPREDAHQQLVRLLAAAGHPGAALRQYKELERLLEEELGQEPSAPVRALARQIERQSELTAAAILTARPPAQPLSPSAAVAVTSDQPQTLTFLITDVEGSTRLRERAREVVKNALEDHHRLLRAEFTRHGGQEIKEAGDSFLVAFTSAGKAIACAVACQQALREGSGRSDPGPEPLTASHSTDARPEPSGPLTTHPPPASWVPVLPLKVRMALHTGDVEYRDGAYHGLAVHRASRMLAAGHGGQILISEATAGLLRGDPEDGVRLMDLGVYRLRDVASPERLFQVEYPGMPETAFPALNAAAGQAASLPLQFTRFFGREREIARLVELLAPRLNGRMDEWTSGRSEPAPETAPASSSTRPLVHSSIQPPSARLVTFTGPGGTGKTRLAIAAAERLVEAYEGAVWFVPLGDLADPQLIAGAILDALRIARSPRQEPIDQAVEALSGKPALLVLDNLEHLLEGEKRRQPCDPSGRPEARSATDAAGVVRVLLERVPTLACLVTSRLVVGLASEREFPVAPLSTPSGPDTPEQLSLFDSVALFVDRAQAVMPHFQITNHNAPAVAELCQRLEGIPLAIELAAARAQVLTPIRMLTHLEDRFTFLASRRRRAPERHRTLRAAIDWSYDLLSPELQRFFARLSVFRGGLTAEVAEVICEEPLALDYLAQLRECSLVLNERRGPDVRFRMLETLREHAESQLEEAESAALGSRHASFFVELAEQAESRLSGSYQQGWLDRLEREHDNLRAALAWGIAQAAASGAKRVGEPEPGSTAYALRPTPSPELALRLAGALLQFWQVRCYFGEGRRWLAAVLGEGDRRSAARGKALNGAGVLAYRQGELGAARASYEESLAIFRELGDRQGTASSLSNLGLTVQEQGGHAAARALHEESLEIRRELGDRHGIAASLSNLGIVAFRQGDYAAARALYEESLAIRRELGDRWGIAAALGNLGVVPMEQGDYAAARAFYEESLAIRRELGDRQGVAILLNNLGNVACEQGDWAGGRALHEESLAIRRDLGDRRGIASSLSNLGNVAFLQGDHAAAHALHEESLAIRRELGDRLFSAISLHSLGNVAREQGDYPVARAFLEESLAIRREVRDRGGIAESLAGFAALGAAQRQEERAARLWGAAEALREAIGAPLRQSERERYDADVSAARAVLGDAAFTAAWAEGRAMTMEPAIAQALEETG